MKKVNWIIGGLVVANLLTAWWSITSLREVHNTTVKNSMRGIGALDESQGMIQAYSELNSLLEEKIATQQ